VEFRIGKSHIVFAEAGDGTQWLSRRLAGTRVI
jgi:hypothetical protein